MESLLIVFGQYLTENRMCDLDSLFGPVSQGFPCLPFSNHLVKKLILRFIYGESAFHCLFFCIWNFSSAYHLQKLHLFQKRSAHFPLSSFTIKKVPDFFSVFLKIINS